MRIPLHAGRDFQGSDGEGPGVVIVTGTMAKRYWGGADPIGKRLRPGNARDWITVVGVVGDVAHRGLDEDPAPLMYFCSYQANWNPMSLIVRTRSDIGAAATTVRATVKAIDRDLPVSDISTLEALQSASVAPRRFNMLMLGLFAVLALVLASVGIYGVMAYAVTQRTHEIGIRMALGSSRSDVLRFVVAQAMRPTLAGVVLGLAASLASSRLMQSLLFGVSPIDPITFAAVPVILAAVALAACAVPARRASRVDP
jgi:putative ABC transport system permease protein